VRGGKEMYCRTSFLIGSFASLSHTLTLRSFASLSHTLTHCLVYVDGLSLV